VMTDLSCERQPASDVVLSAAPWRRTSTPPRSAKLVVMPLRLTATSQMCRALPVILSCSMKDCIVRRALLCAVCCAPLPTGPRAGSAGTDGLSNGYGRLAAIPKPGLSPEAGAAGTTSTAKVVANGY
jgi:hypothetical protein